MNISCRSFRKVFLLGSLFWFNIGANALTLEEALVAVYKDNPQLQGAREQAKQVDEQIMKALDGWFPDVVFKAGKEYRKTTGIKHGLFDGNTTRYVPDPNPSSSVDGISTNLIIQQNLYKSGADIANINKARSTIKASHAELQGNEQEIFKKVVQTYTETLKLYESYKVAQDMERDSLKQFEGTKQRVLVGTQTKTNLAQAEAAYTRAKANRIKYKADYETSKAALESWVGKEVTSLGAPNGQLSLPINLDETIDHALRFNPEIVQSANSFSAAQKNIDVIRGAVLPQINANYQISDASRTANPTFKKTYTTTVELVVPILNVGSWSTLREAKREAAKFEYNAQTKKDTVRASAVSAWSNFQAAKAYMKAAQSMSEAMKLAYEGTQASEKVGLVDMFELIGTREKYFNYYIDFLSSKAQYYQSMYALKAVVGECTARGLKLNVPLYDPRDNYNSIKWQIIGAF